LNKFILISSILFFSYNFSFSQQEKITYIHKKLSLADSNFNTNQLNEAISFALEVYNFDFKNVSIPVSKDKKWNYYMSFFEVDFKSDASFILGQAYFKKENYDSSLYYLNQVSLPINYAAAHNYTYSLEMDIHLSYLKSICLEKNNEKVKAELILQRYLFLDRIQTKHIAWFTQKELVDRYKLIASSEIILDSNSFFFLPKDSINFFSWHQYYGPRTDLYVKIGKTHCPILPLIQLNEINSERKFQDFEKIRALVLSLYYFKV
jgi:tetratricopeptide (TPR) repeat protein